MLFRSTYFGPVILSPAFIRLGAFVLNDDHSRSYGLNRFPPKFVFGLCDYEMGVYPFDLFVEEYTEEGRGIVEQRINLTRQEKLDIVNALALNARPENKVYRYNLLRQYKSYPYERYI